LALKSSRVVSSSATDIGALVNPRGTALLLHSAT
jgi:hypothetical protein